nr:hypothetical protein Iba_chr07fCG12280 [Ipomoea batatas]
MLGPLISKSEDNFPRIPSFVRFGVLVKTSSVQLSGDIVESVFRLPVMSRSLLLFDASGDGKLVQVLVWRCLNRCILHISALISRVRCEVSIMRVCIFQSQVLFTHIMEVLGALGENTQYVEKYVLPIGLKAIGIVLADLLDFLPNRFNLSCRRVDFDQMRRFIHVPGHHPLGAVKLGLHHELVDGVLRLVDGDPDLLHQLLYDLVLAAPPRRLLEERLEVAEVAQEALGLRLYSEDEVRVVPEELQQILHQELHGRVRHGRRGSAAVIGERLRSVD